ncbi:MAG: hypothetical protein U9Q98_07905, partial [Bacteroidota bacterium]|nr:hypothetical protein [Bacteroidota bacterium]
KFQVIVGGGFNLSCVFGEQMQSLFYSLNRIQLGVQFNMGFGYQLSSKWGMLFVYQNNIDIVPLYSFEASTPGGTEYVEGVRGCDGFIKVGVRYTLK